MTLGRVAVLWMISAAAALAQSNSSDIPVFGTTTYIPSGLKGGVYLLREGESRLPDFDSRSPLGYLYTNKLNIPNRDFSFGFPGITGQTEWFAIDYRGRFWVRKPGKYNFALTSDDGSRLYIDGKLLIDNDGVHAAQTITGSIHLEPRLHTIRISYFQGPKFQLALVLAAQAPGEKWRVFDMKDYSPEGEQLTPEEMALLDRQDREDAQRRQKQDATSAIEKEAIAILHQPEPQHAFDFRSGVYSFRGTAGKTRHVLAFELPASELRDTVDDSTRAHRYRFSAFFAVKDSDGRYIEKFSIDSPYSVAADKYEAFKKTAFTTTRPFTLAPGAYTLEAVVFDRLAQTSSVARFPIDSLPAGLGLSTPVLVERVTAVSGEPDPADGLVTEGKRLVPRLKPNVPPNVKPALYFVVYPNPANSAAATLRIAFLVDGKQAAEQTSPLPAPGKDGAIPLTIAAAAQPGACELRITAVQGEETVTQTLRYTVEATAQPAPSR